MPESCGMSFSFPPFPDKKDIIVMLRKAVEKGLTFFDTAEVYGPFVNEELVGRPSSLLKMRWSLLPNSDLIFRTGKWLD